MMIYSSIQHPEYLIGCYIESCCPDNWSCDIEETREQRQANVNHYSARQYYYVQSYYDGVVDLYEESLERGGSIVHRAHSHKKDWQ